MKTPNPPGGNSCYPCLRLFIAFAAGIMFAGQFPPIPALIPLAAAVLLFGFGALCGMRGRKTAILLGVVLFGAAVFGASQPSSDRIRSMFISGELAADRVVDVRGRLIADPEPSVGGMFLELRVDSLGIGRGQRDASGNIRLFATSHTDEMAEDYRRLDLRYGDEIDVTCRLERSEPFRNPGTETRLRQMDAQGIDATGVVRSPMLVRKISVGGGPLRLAYDARAAATSAFRRHLSPSAAGVMIASLLGNKEFLDRRTAEVFRDGGTFHVLVISGLHITVIGALIVGALVAAGFSRRTQLFVAVPLIWAYAIAVGGDVPVTRAAIMFSAVLAGRALFRDTNLINLLGLSGIVLLFTDPGALFSASFQLTLMSVAAIVGIAFPLIGKMRRIGTWTPDARQPFPPTASRLLVRFCEFVYWNPVAWKIESARNLWSAVIPKSESARRGRAVLQFLVEAILVSSIVQIALLPLSVFYFNRISPGSVFFNVWVGIILTAESVTAMLTIAVGALSDAAAVPLAGLTDWLNQLMISVPEALAQAGLGSRRLPAYSLPFSAVYALFYLPLIAVAIGLDRWDPFSLKAGKPVSRIAIASVLILSLVVGTSPYAGNAPDGRLSIEFIDVGQGDSALITFPDGRTMLVDGGGRPDYRQKSDEDAETGFEPDRITIGESVVSRFLWHRGLRSVDYVVATHADADHIQGLADVVRNFDVRAVFVGRVAAGDPDFDALVESAGRKGVTVKPLGRGDMFMIAGVRIDVFHPAVNRLSANNDSLVIKLTFGKIRFLLTGDIESDAETALVGATDDLHADVVKVAHHGSKTSSTSEFVNATGARFAVIPVGLKSPFGHPSKTVIARWRSAGAVVLTTGQSGLVSFQTDGSEINIGTHVK